MDQIGVRELRQNASKYLARVAAEGEPIEITARGRPIARIVPIVDADWDNMIVAGAITPASIDFRSIEPISSQVNASEALTELRAHER